VGFSFAMRTINSRISHCRGGRLERTSPTKSASEYRVDTTAGLRGTQLHAQDFVACPK
jgi:hypothetical protein